jgi:hypothetical protein
MESSQTAVFPGIKQTRAVCCYVSYEVRIDHYGLSGVVGSAMGPAGTRAGHI